MHWFFLTGDYESFTRILFVAVKDCNAILILFSVLRQDVLLSV